MKNKKRFGFILALALLVSALFIFIAIAFKDDPFTVLGKFYKGNIERKAEVDDSKVLATVGGKRITQKLVDDYKMSYEIFGDKKSEEEIIKKIATDILLTKEAQEHNITVSDDEVSKVIEDQMKLLKKTTTYKEFQNYLSGADITEEEYIKIVTPIYKKLIIQGTYKNKILKPDFKEKNNDISEAEFHNAFEDYYQKYKEKLFDNAEIKYLN
ncbi:SurA N-terminal domain-containing protein [Eubacteriales bacterium mix99]|jgi:hypothetical protein|nr:hypothetical protein [Clostridiales bacterium]